MRSALMVGLIIAVSGAARGGELSLDQGLIVACHHLKIDDVVAALRGGADASARFGEGDVEALMGWDGGVPVAAKAWTPLIAVATASRYPARARHLSVERRDTVLAQEIQQRQRDAVTIALILLSHKADIDAEDGYGGTALYAAIYQQNVELAKLLLRFNANVNTKTGVYIDGTGDITPLHRAWWSAELTKLLLEKGADPSAKDSEGRTPRDWVKMFSEIM